MEDFDDVLALANEQKVEEKVVEETPAVEKVETVEKVVEKVVEQTPPTDDDDIEFGDEEDSDNGDDDTIIALSKEIGIEAKNKKQLKEFIETSKSYKEKAESKFANEELKKLDDYVRDGGDIKNYLKIESKIGELDAIKQEVEKMTNAESYEIYLRKKLSEDGMFDANEIDEQIEGMMLVDEDKIERIGKKYKEDALLQLQNELKNETEKKETEILGIKEKTKVFNTEIQKGISALSKVDGVIVKAEQRTQLQEIAKNPKQVIKDFFPIDENGVPNSEVWAKNIFTLMNHKANLKLAFEKGKSNAKKELYNGIGNVNDGIQTNSLSNRPLSKEEKELKEAIDNM